MGRFSGAPRVNFNKPDDTLRFVINADSEIADLFDFLTATDDAVSLDNVSELLDNSGCEEVFEIEARIVRRGTAKSTVEWHD